MMRMTPFIAFRHLRTRLRSTLLTSLGVALGVAVMITMASLLLGLQQQFIQNVLETTPNVSVEGVRVGEQRRETAVPQGPDTVVGLSRARPPQAERGISDYRDLVGQIETLPGVTGASATLTGQALLRYGTRTQPVRLIGIDPASYGHIVAWETRLEQQTGSLETAADGAVLGILLAKNQGIPPGAAVTLVTGPAREQRVRAVAFYNSGVRQLDENTVFVTIALAQRLLGRPAEVSQIGVRVADVNQAPEIALRVRSVTGLRARSWQDLNANFFAIFALQNATNAIVIAFIVLIAGFGITNGLIALILEKQRDIGILKALGTPNERIAAIFLLEGLTMGLLGALLGMGLAAISVHILANTSLHGEGELTTANTFTMLRTPPVFLIPALLAITISILASLLPVRRATGYDPVTIIRSAK